MKKVKLLLKPSWKLITIVIISKFSWRRDIESIDLGISRRYYEAFFDRDLSVVILARYLDTGIFIWRM